MPLVAFQLFPIKGPDVKFTCPFSDASCGGLGLLSIEVFNGNQPCYNFAIPSNENLLALLDAVQQRFQPIFRLKRANFRHAWKTITGTEGTEATAMKNPPDPGDFNYWDPVV